jgi:hypothetical protein
MSTDPLTPVASALMPDGGTLPADPGIMGTPDLSPISRMRSDAMARIQALKGDKPFQDLLLRGDPHALAEVQRLQKIVSSPTSTIVGSEPNPTEVQARLDTWSNFAGLDPGVLEQVRESKPVTQAEYKMAQQTKARLMADREWAKRYLDGGRAERQQLSLISIILSSPIAAEQT